MNDEKVIKKMNKFDWGLMFVPPILAVVFALISEGGQGGLMILPIALIYSVFYSGFFLAVAFVLASFLGNKLIFRIMVIVLAVPLIFFAIEFIFAKIISFGN